MNNSTNYDPVLLTKRLVYGTENPSDDFNEHIRPDGEVPQSVTYSMKDYMESGSGRYAIPSIFPIVDKFFSSFEIEPGNYDTPEEIRDVLDLGDINPDTGRYETFNQSKRTAIWQYGTDTISSDFPERAYIFGTSDFILDLTNARFIVDDNGDRSIIGMKVTPGREDFDFSGGAGPINYLANLVLNPAFDPYELKRKAVPLKFAATDSYDGEVYGTSSDPYTISDYNIDSSIESRDISIAGTLSGYSKLATGVASLINVERASLAGSYLGEINQDPLFRYEKDDFKVVYGTLDNDNISSVDAEGFDGSLPFPVSARKFLMVGGQGNDIINGGLYNSNKLLGGDDNDKIKGGDTDDTLNGGSGDDNLDGGKGEDVAIFSDSYSTNNPDYDIVTDPNTKVTTITHLNGGIDGTDTLKNVEFAQFNGGTGQQTTLSATTLANSNNGAVTNSNTASEEGRIIPLPLTDGVEDTEFVEVASTEANPNPNDPPTPPYVSLTTPADMLDGDIEYTVNISPFKPDTNYNISYIVSTSPRTSGVKGQQVKDAVIDLNDYFVETGVAENSNFAVVQFNEQAYLYRDLTSSQAATTIENLTTFGDYTNKYNDALFNAALFTAQSPLDRNLVTNIAYFIADGKSYQNFFDPYDYSYHLDAQTLRAVSNVQAFGLDVPHSVGDSLTVQESQINFVDSNDGVIIDDTADLSSELFKSGLADDVESVNILLDGVVVETLTPDQFTDSPLGLTYSGTAEDETEIEELDVSVDAENVITAEVIFTSESNFATTEVEQTVTAGKGEVVDENGDPIDESGNNSGDEDPFERERIGGDGNDDITLGFIDKGASGGAGGDKIVGNRRDNILDGGSGNDTIFGHEGNDTIITGMGINEVDGGEGNDTALYSDVVYEGNNSLSFGQTGNTLVYLDGDNAPHTDYLTNVEYLQFSDVRISADTLEITPTIEEISDVSILEGETASFSFNLDYAAPVDIVLDYTTEDIDAVAGDDYVATSGQVTIPAGETTATIEVTTTEDTAYDESTETFSLNLTGLTGATFSNNQTELSLLGYIENIEGDKTLIGTAEDDFLTGGSGNDSLLGRNGNDFIEGKGGNDTLRGENGDDYLDGGDGDDSLFGNAGNDTVIGGLGSDTLVHAVNANMTLSDTELISDGTDSLDSIEVVNLIGGNDKNIINALQTTQVNTIVNAQGGNDVIVGGEGEDVIIGGLGNDTILSSVGNDVLKGDLGNDSLNGSFGDDTLFGAAGDDTIIGGSGFDVLIEAGDFDFTLTDNSLVGNGTDSLTAIQDVRLTGGNSNNLIDASATAVINKTVLTGGSGDDTLLGGGKQDTLKGDAGNDLLEGGNFRDVLFGGNDEDILMGMNGNDVLKGEAGEDTLVGGQGRDLYFGGTGADVFTIEVLDDQDVIFDFEDGIDSFSLGSDTSFEDLRITGNPAGTVSAIRLESNNQILAVVRDVDYNDITAEDFI